ncbi:MAG: UDP-N-acetylmuramoyl-tripeptide--D-alanyl-D-alanine ligase [Pseudomonadota bacterium]
MTFTSDFVLRATGGRLVGSGFVARRVDKDSRVALDDTLYVALAGDRFDGHDFVRQAREAGAVAALVDAAHARSLSDPGYPLVVVEDTGRALLDLAHAHLQRMPARRVALTGSNGKTTTKEMIAAVCRASVGDERVLATQGNLNNLIGMPLTALAVGPDHAIAVLEMGMNHPGEIAAMAAAARPQVGLITNIAPAHLEGLGNLEGVARAKGELFAALGSDAVAVVHADDANCLRMAEGCRARQLRFGSAAGCEVRLRSSTPDEQGQTLVLELAGVEHALHLSHEGAHNARNAAAAAAVGLALEVPVAHIVEGLVRAPVVAGRLRMHRVRDALIIDDTYNANPASMKAAIDVAVQRARGHRLLLVLGEMRELGAFAGDLHAELGAHAATAAPARAWFCGAFAEDYRRGAQQGGLDPATITVAGDAGEIAAEVVANLAAGDVVLVKGSRGARTERVVQAMTGQLDGVH